MAVAPSTPCCEGAEPRHPWWDRAGTGRLLAARAGRRCAFRRRDLAGPPGQQGRGNLHSFRGPSGIADPMQQHLDGWAVKTAVPSELAAT